MSTRKAAMYVLQRFLLQKKFLLAQADPFGLRFRVKTEDAIGRHIYKYGQHDPALTAFLQHMLRPVDGDVMIDVGANIGWYSLLFDRLAGSFDVKIISLEPDPLNFRLLQENLNLNRADKVLAYQLAIGDMNGTARLHLFSDSNRGRHSILPIHTAETVTIETVCLDDLWKQEGLADRHLRLMKIDIEGYELVALRGATDVLSRCELLLIEFSPRYMKKGGLDPAALLALLETAGFQLHRLIDGHPQPVDRTTLLADERHDDLICRRH